MNSLPAAHAVVTCDGRRRALRPGQTLTVGRGQDNDLRIGHDPENRRIPRAVCRLECRPDGILIHNASNKVSLMLTTFPGPGLEIPPLMVTGTRPHSLVRITVPDGGAGIAIDIDARLLGGAPEPDENPGSHRADVSGTVGYARIESISPQQRRLLCALCLPLMTRSGADVPTYAEMEQILRRYGHAIRARTIRNNLDELRAVLSNEFGIVGLSRDRPGGSSSSHETYLPALEQWARRSQNVTEADLERLLDGDPADD
jgi:hypothetical protein